MRKIILFLLAAITAFSLFSCADTDDTSRDKYVYISEKSATFSEIGETLTLYAEMRPVTSEEVTITWSSSDENVVVVDNGVITVVGYGYAVVRATAPGGYSAACTIAVPNPNPQMTLSETTLTFSQIEQTKKIRAYDMNGEEITELVAWYTSNPKIAMCDEEGVVTLIGFGYCTITAKTKNGISSDCLIKAPDPSEQKFEVSEKTYTFDSLGESKQLYATLNAETVDAEWMSSDTEVAVCENGLVRAVGEGVAVIIAVNSDGKTAATVVYVGQRQVPELPEGILNFEIKDLPVTVHHINKWTGEINASVVITSYTTSWEYENDDVLLFSVVYDMVKVYDKNGMKENYEFYVDAELYTENDNLLTTMSYEFDDYIVGQKFSYGQYIRYSLKQTLPRESYIKFVEYLEK